MTVYLLSGLGADYRAFAALKLSKQYECVHIPYIDPFKNEAFTAYVKRLSKQIDTSKPFAIIGLSFGGMVAIELLDFLQPEKTILISSITNRNELPLLYRIGGKLRLHQLIPAKKVNRPNRFTYWLFGIHTHAEKEQLAAVLTSTHTIFSKWAVNAILHWDRKICTQKICRIHGSNDRLLPSKKAMVDYWIEDGGHLLVLQRGEEVSAIVEAILEE